MNKLLLLILIWRWKQMQRKKKVLLLLLILLRRRKRKRTLYGWRGGKVGRTFKRRKRNSEIIESQDMKDHPVHLLNNWLSDKVLSPQMDQYHQQVRSHKIRRRMRVNQIVFKYILNCIKPALELSPDKLKYTSDIVDTTEALAITLHYLGSTERLDDIGEFWCRSRGTISKHISKVCQAIFNNMFDSVIQLPDPKESLVLIDMGKEKRKVPHCIGALDGKFFYIKHDNHRYSCYKKANSHAVNMVGFCDILYRFRYLSDHYNAPTSDSSILRGSTLYQKLYRERSYPNQSISGDNCLYRKINESDTKQFLPFIIVDKGLSLSKFFMKARRQDGQLFSGFLNKMRQIIEQSWGMLCNKFRRFKLSRLIVTTPVNLQDFSREIHSACIIHNLCRDVNIYLRWTVVDRREPKNRTLINSSKILTWLQQQDFDIIYPALNDSDVDVDDDVQTDYEDEDNEITINESDESDDEITINESDESDDEITINESDESDDEHNNEIITQQLPVYHLSQETVAQYSYNANDLLIALKTYCNDNFSLVNNYVTPLR